jgi:hypothetical protein
MFGLRVLAAVLSGLWTIAAALVLLGYRPGGPIDGLVGLATLLPVAVSLLGLLWPPVVRGDRAFAGVAWLGIAAVLLLIPSIAGVFGQLMARGPQTLLPSWEAVYPWILALLATSLFGGLGVARHVLGGTALRRRRLELGLVVAVGATVLSGSAFAAAAIANDFALRDRAALSSRFGPTTGAADPPACTTAVVPSPTATLVEDIAGDVDGRPIGTIRLQGVRDGQSVEWTADLATEVTLGQFDLVRIGDRVWTRAPRDEWVEAPRAASAAGASPIPPPIPPIAGIGGVPSVVPPTGVVPTGAASPAFVRPGVDLEVQASALTTGYRSAAEDRGLEFVEGARARHCRVALDGRTFQAAFPVATWMSVRQDLHRWRGTLDFWLFLDGEVGKVTATVNGEAAGVGRTGLQANLEATLTIVDRGSLVTIEAPTK